MFIKYTLNYRVIENYLKDKNKRIKFEHVLTTKNF